MSAAALRAASVILLASALACVATLHAVSRDLDPTSRRLSEYANGPYGYLMTAAFMAVGAGLLALAAGLHRARNRMWRPRFVAAGTGVAGFGMVLSGIFPTDPDPADSMRETIHSLASGLASVALIATAVAWAVLGRRRTPGRWQPSAPTAAFAALAALLGLAGPWLHESRWTGLSQRTLWVALLGWLFLLTWSLRASRPPTSARPSALPQRVAG